MDDINFDQSFGAPAPRTNIEEAWHNEQRRKQYDIVRVKNPTNQDFFVMYDINQYQRIPANTTIDIPRYIALRYITHMKDKIIHDQAQAMHDATIAERNAKGFPAYKSKYEENEETYNAADYPKTNDPKRMAEVIDGLWVGLVHEFGRDVPPGNVDPRSGEVDLTPPEIKIMEGLDKRRAPQTPEPVAPSPAFSQISEKLSPQEVTAE